MGMDWKAALEPHYATAKRMLGAVPSEVIVETDRMLEEIAKDMGRGDTFHRATVGVYFGEAGKTVPDPFFGGEGPDRTGCIKCGGCMVGCRHGAKNTLDLNYLSLLKNPFLLMPLILPAATAYASPPSYPSSSRSCSPFEVARGRAPSAHSGAGGVVGGSGDRRSLQTSKH